MSKKKENKAAKDRGIESKPEREKERLVSEQICSPYVYLAYKKTFYTSDIRLYSERYMALSLQALHFAFARIEILLLRN